MSALLLLKRDFLAENIYLYQQFTAPLVIRSIYTEMHGYFFASQFASVETNSAAQIKPIAK